jgi:hypothetical protein
MHIFSDLSERRINLKNALILIVFFIALWALIFLGLPKDQEKKELMVEQPTAFTEMPMVVESPTAALTPTSTPLKVVVDPSGWVNNNNCTISAVVENIGIEDVRFQLTFNGVPWYAELIPKGRSSAEIPLTFGNIGQGYLMIHVRGDVNQTNRVWCSSSSFSGLSSEGATPPIATTPTATTTPTVTVTLPSTTATLPPASIPEFPSLAFPVLSVFILIFLFRKN